MAKAITVPTSMMLSPGTVVPGATAGVDWIWTVSYAGADVPNSPSTSENVAVNVVGADTLATVRTKLQTAIAGIASRRWGATVLGTDILMADMQFGV